MVHIVGAGMERQDRAAGEVEQDGLGEGPRAGRSTSVKSTRRTMAGRCHKPTGVIELCVALSLAVRRTPGYQLATAHAARRRSRTDKAQVQFTSGHGRLLGNESERRPNLSHYWRNLAGVKRPRYSVSSCCAARRMSSSSAISALRSS